MLRAAALFLFCNLAFADEATLAWEHPSDTLQYRVYLDGSPLLETDQKQAEITLPSEGGSLTVTAFIGERESEHSVPLVVDPDAPTGLIITTTTTVVTSAGGG